MIETRPSQDRDYTDHGWLKSYHSFSFADYIDPQHVQFEPLRVINEDRVAAGMGLGTRGHRDMEIISYVLDGELAHKDSIGNGNVLRRGDVQRMTAGTGVRHSEFNHTQDQATHFLQVWVLPAQLNLTSGYEECHFDEMAKRGRLALIVNADGHDGSVKVHQNMALYADKFNGAETASLPTATSRRAYVHVVRDKVSVNDRTLMGGDAAKPTQEETVMLSGDEDGEVLVFDLPQCSWCTLCAPFFFSVVSPRYPNPKRIPAARVAAVYRGGCGHTKRQAETVFVGVQGAGVEVHLIPVTDVNDGTWALLAGIDTTVFGALAYMGGVSGDFKKFADASSKVWFTGAWKNKIAAEFMNSASMNGDKYVSIQYLRTLSQQHGMIQVGMGMMPANSKAATHNDANYLAGFGNALARSPSDASPEEDPLPDDLETAKLFGGRIITITNQFVRGRQQTGSLKEKRQHVRRFFAGT